MKMYNKAPTLPHHILFGCSELPGHTRLRREGLSLTAGYTEKSVQGTREFAYKESDVIVAAYPRAGATLVQEIAYLLLNKPQPVRDNITDRMPCLEHHGRPLLPPRGLKTASNLREEARILKSHLPANFLEKALDTGSKVIYVMRNPKDLCASYYEFYKGSRLWGNWSFATFQHLFFSTDKLCFGNVFDHYADFWDERSRGNVLIVFYEDILRNKSREICKIAKFLNAQTDKDGVDYIKDMTNFDVMKEDELMDPLAYERVTAQIRLDYNFYSRGKVGYWREYFDQSKDCQYDDVIRARMTSEGIYFNYGVDKKRGVSLCDQCGAKLDEKCKKDASNQVCFFKNFEF